MTTCVRLKVLYMKHYNNTHPKLIMHYISHSILPLPTHVLMHTCTPTHSCNPLLLSLLVSTCLVPPLQLRGYKVGITQRPETSGHREKSAQQCHPLVPQVKKRWTQFDQLKQVGLETNHTKTHASHPRYKSGPPSQTSLQTVSMMFLCIHKQKCSKTAKSNTHSHTQAEILRIWLRNKNCTHPSLCTCV